MINPLYGPRETHDNSEEPETDFVVARQITDRVIVKPINDDYAICELRWGIAQPLRYDNEWIALRSDIDTYRHSFEAMSKELPRFDYVKENPFDSHIQDDPRSLRQLNLEQFLTQNTFDPKCVVNLSSMRIPGRELPIAHVLCVQIPSQYFDLVKAKPHLEKHPWLIEIETKKDGFDIYVKPSQEEFDAYNLDLAKDNSTLSDFMLEEIAIWPFRKEDRNHENWIPEYLDPSRADPLGLSQFAKPFKEPNF